MDVGFDALGLLTSDVSREPLGNGDEDRVVGDDAERYAERVKDRSSAAVANRDSSSSPL
jgi:hypothetical protein